MDTVNVSFQILPRVEGMHIYDAVDRAIAVVQASGVKYEVGPMETTMEGDDDQLMGIVKQAQEACMAVGASSVMTIIKVSWVQGGASIDAKIGKYRAGFVARPARAVRMRSSPNLPAPLPTREGGAIHGRGNGAALPLLAPGRAGTRWAGGGGAVRRHALPLAVLIGLVAIWEAWVRLFHVDPHELPAPSRILGAFRGQGNLYADNTWRTVQETAVGFTVAVLIGLFFAFVIDATPLLRRAVYPLWIGSQTIPIIAIAPLLIIRLGFGLAPKVVIIVLYCFFPIVVSTVDGLALRRAGDAQSAACDRGASWQLLRVARIPAALPSIFSGVKIAATYAVTGAVVSEWLGGSKGLGVSMIRAQKSFAPDKVFAAVLIVMLLTLALFLIIDLAARWLMPRDVSARKEYSE